jgi:23S rRNA (pseudouridine1915-N3)-methyltransferase
MKVTLLVIGKTDKEYLREGIDVYTKRLFHYIPFEIKTIPDIKNSKNLSHEQQKTREGEQMLAHIQPADCLILLDENGKEFSSVDFSRWIEQQMVASVRHIVFVIGGPYGFSQSMHKRANSKISLSKMTFSHQMVRVIFTEQLYRAMTIIKGEPYHHQ